MDAKDPTIHTQLQHIVDTGRKAVAADRAIFLVQMYDDVREAEATMVTFAVKEEINRDKEALVESILMLRSAMKGLVEGSGGGVTVEVRLIGRDGSFLVLEEPGFKLEYPMEALKP